jgi:hypothetical protein
MSRKHRADSHYGARPVDRFVLDRPAQAGDDVWVVLNGRRGKQTFHAIVQEVLGNGWARVINCYTNQDELVMLSQCQPVLLVDHDSDPEHS